MMQKKIADIDAAVLADFRLGCVIPAQPLALDEQRRLSPRYQRALCRYYIDAGAGGIAVGVHSTQFEIRNPKIGLFEPLLEQCSGFVDDWSAHRGRKILKVAGVCGLTGQALSEAGFALQAGYDACLLSLAAFKQASVADMLQHCRELAQIMPIIGFYLQPSVGGAWLPYQFWREFVEIDNVLGIKIAPFNRYATFDVLRAVAESGADISLYTGNDDNILLDLLSVYEIAGRRLRIKGGLLGHWCCWTRKAVELLQEVQALSPDTNEQIPAELLSRNLQITDCNAAFFDPANNFAGCIPGIHEVLFRQGLLPSRHCLDPDEKLSPGQAEEISRVQAAYPHLNDDQFVKDNLELWLNQ
ncbi:MAG: dihydrodipicolinate synthase family protein [Lentisphaeria bacterium]